MYVSSLVQVHTETSVFFLLLWIKQTKRYISFVFGEKTDRHKGLVAVIGHDRWHNG